MVFCYFSSSLNISSCHTPNSMWVNASEFASKDNNEIASFMYSFLTLFYNFQFLLGLFYFPREVFDIMYEDFLYSFYSLISKFSGKVLLVILLLLFFSFILYMPTKLFLSGTNKKII